MQPVELESRVDHVVAVMRFDRAATGVTGGRSTDLAQGGSPAIEMGRMAGQ
jgi:hypothetical protein